MDIASIAGLLLALAAIAGGMLLEGGSLAQIAQPTAMLIVLGGTLGAVLLQFPPRVFWQALTQGGRAFLAQTTLAEAADELTLTQIVVFAAKARRSGIVSLDSDLNSIEDTFLKQAMMLAIDLNEPIEVRTMMELQMENSAERDERIPQVFEAIGGYAPTVGIIGAVLGLIQVMQHLDDLAAVGRGIAVAFVATIYGVALANLIALPIAGKLKLHHEEQQHRRRMIIEGVILVLEGMSPRLIEMRLRTFLEAVSSAPLRETAEAAERVPA